MLCQKVSAHSDHAKVWLACSLRYRSRGPSRVRFASYRERVGPLVRPEGYSRCEKHFVYKVFFEHEKGQLL
jgi:hypothetical protein